MNPRGGAALARSFRALAALGVFALAACGGRPAEVAPRLPPLHLDPATDLAPAASLVWLVEVHPKALLGKPETTLAVRALFPDDKFAVFAERHGGVDLRRLDALVIAGYPKATLAIARGVVDPSRVEAAFQRSVRVEGRGVDRAGGPLDSIQRTWGTELASGERRQIALFGHEAAALEWGQLGPLRIAELFAEDKLHKAAPALRRAPLARAAEVLGDAPVRAFAPGPFEGEWAAAFGGLLGASTAVAIGATPVSGGGEGGALLVRIAVFGSWGKDAAAAGTRVVATLDALSSSAIGRLCGVDRPIAGPTLRASDDVVIVETTVDAMALFRGLAAATEASMDDVMR